ncbi:MAG: hypothetical protein ACW964_17035 [Candidatus Hodarchaeales archaeon]|jgi:hypothetical protein
MFNKLNYDWDNYSSLHSCRSYEALGFLQKHATDIDAGHMNFTLGGFAEEITAESLGINRMSHSHPHDLEDPRDGTKGENKFGTGKKPLDHPKKFITHDYIISNSAGQNNGYIWKFLTAQCWGYTEIKSMLFLSVFDESAQKYIREKSGDRKNTVLPVNLRTGFPRVKIPDVRNLQDAEDAKPCLFKKVDLGKNVFNDISKTMLDDGICHFDQHGQVGGRRFIKNTLIKEIERLKNGNEVHRHVRRRWWFPFGS